MTWAFPPEAGKLLFIVGRVAGLTAEVAEELCEGETDADPDSGDLRRCPAGDGLASSAVFDWGKPCRLPLQTSAAMEKSP
jgi:hypothetical protein